jgi:regulator of sigma E protease
VAPDSPAEKAGIRPGDRIVKLDGKRNPTWEDVSLSEDSGAYRPLQVFVERAGHTVEFTVVPTLSDLSGVGTAGWYKQGQVELRAVEVGMPAEKAGLKPGDTILSVNGQPINTTLRLQEVTRNSGGQPVLVEFERKGQRQTLQVQPVFDKKDGPARWMIGVSPSLKYHLVDTRLSLPAALDQSLRENAKGATTLVRFLEGVVQRRMSAKNITGPIGMIEISGAAAREGPSVFLGLMAMVSLQLAIFNLLPIPILDGGVILMLLIEMTMRRDMSLSVKEAVLKAGFVFIMVIVALAVYNDISRYLPAG